MDCNVVTKRIKEIRREARQLEKLLGDANTGRDFTLRLNVIEAHLQAIRAEIGR